MRNDSYLKIALVITSIIISLSLFSNLSNKQKISGFEPATTSGLKSKDTDNIRKLLDEGKLSTKEALFYEKTY